MEMVDIVDEDDNVIGQASREEKIEKGLLSRNVAIFLHDGTHLLIAKRAASKSSFPNRLDAAVCGMAMAGETHEEAALRELKEELGIECELTFLDKVYNEFTEKSVTQRYLTGVFAGFHDGAFTLNEELSEMKKMLVDEVEELIEQDPEQFTPGFVHDFQQRKEQLKGLIQ